VFVATLVSTLFRKQYCASWGVKPLIVLGAAIVAFIVWNLPKDAAKVGPLWQVFLAVAVFLYLWWLAALIFDLVFVWHLYIRHSKANTRMRGMCGLGKGPKVV
jgi:hypothetical protein